VAPFLPFVSTAEANIDGIKPLLAYPPPDELPPPPTPGIDIVVVIATLLAALVVLPAPAAVILEATVNVPRHEKGELPIEGVVTAVPNAPPAAPVPAPPPPGKVVEQVKSILAAVDVSGAIATYVLVGEDPAVGVAPPVPSAPPVPVKIYSTSGKIEL
jgi:hypothetical protein